VARAVSAIVVKTNARKEEIRRRKPKITKQN